tara:strand:- start:1998 stop:2906 length:909 start_codon:yes stop_codon:yes gene_type:complete
MFSEHEKNAKHVEDHHDEYQYLDLIRNIINNGSWENGRNGNTKVIIGNSMRFNLSNGAIPLLTTKKLAWKTCLKELFWFISGSTDNTILNKNNVKIWNGNEEDYKIKNDNNLEDGELGPIYGHQWRFFNAPYKTCKDSYTNCGVDQLQNIIDDLKNKDNRTSRRLILSAWNPEQLNEMALPPCHVLVQFHVTNGDELSCSLYQRSGDVGLGVPFNIASYSFLTHILANHCGLKPKEFIHFLGNAHIYDDHIESLKLQLNNTPLSFPKINIKNKYENINHYSLDDIEIIDYMHCEQIKMEMRK